MYVYLPAHTDAAQMTSIRHNASPLPWKECVHNGSSGEGLQWKSGVDSS